LRHAWQSWDGWAFRSPKGFGPAVSKITLVRLPPINNSTQGNSGLAGETAMRSFLRSIAAAVLALAALNAVVGKSFADARVALVIGNSAYEHIPRLRNPQNDAQDVAAALKRSGFDTILATNLDKAGMDNAAIRFARAARGADVALLYYSGHALQFAGVNYLAPIDARLADEADLRRMVRLDDMVADLAQAKNLRILVLDSCRDNPLAEELRRSIGTARALPLQRGLAKIETAQGMIVAYATQAGHTAEDGEGRNSPYTAAFLKNIETQEEIGTIFRRVSADVYEATKRQQLPELSLSLIGEFYLRGKIEITTRPNASPPPQVSPPQQGVEDQAAKAWAATQNTTSVAVLQEFIRQFGGTIYGGLARARLGELKKSQEAVTEPNARIRPDVPAAVPKENATPPEDRGAREWAATDQTSVAALENFIREFGDTYYGVMALNELNALKRNQSDHLPKPNAALVPEKQNAIPKPPEDRGAKEWAATNRTSVAALENFVREFGDTYYGVIALNELSELKRAQSDHLPTPNTARRN
jgi:Caspase domain